MFREFIKTQRRNQYLLVITDLFSTLTKKVPMKGPSVAEGVGQFMNALVLNYGPPEELIAVSGS